MILLLSFRQLFKLSTVVSCFFILSLSSCFSAKNKIKDSVVLQVNSNTLTLTQFADRLSFLLKNYDLISLKGTGYLKRTKNRVLKEFIVESLTQDWANSHNIIVTKKELKEKIKHFLSQFPDDYSFRKTLLKEKISYKEWEKKIYKLLLQQKVQEKLFKMNTSISEEELKRYYKNHRDQFKNPNRIKVQQIVLATKSDATRILKSLKKGANFSEYAEKYSISPEGRDQKGVLGWITPGSSDIFEFLFTKPRGYMSGIRKSNFGYHILKILDKKRSSRKSFKESRNEIINIIKNKKMQAIFSSWLEKQTRKAKILKNDTLISKITIETLGNSL